MKRPWVLNVRTRMLHYRAGRGGTPERCNVDAIKGRQHLTTEQARDRYHWGLARLCWWCYPLVPLRERADVIRSR